MHDIEMDGAKGVFGKIIVSFFGTSYDSTVSWDELVQLRDAIADSFAAILGTYCLRFMQLLLCFKNVCLTIKAHLLMCIYQCLHMHIVDYFHGG